MNVDGGCHCGFVRYVAQVDPERVVICNCTDCQKLSGSAFRVVVQTRPGTFRLLCGTPKIYLKVAESGAERELGFCPECGTSLFSRPTNQEQPAMGLRVGTITQRDDLVPTDQYWARSSQTWLTEIPRIHEWQTQPAFRPDGAFKE